MTVAVALDLGSTRIKAARLQADGRLTGMATEASPPLNGHAGIRQGNARHYLAAAEAVLAKVLSSCRSNVPVAVASQRSSFLLWERGSGKPATPMISWQDRRAQPWCQANQEQYASLAVGTGLPLSPHYAGPKLAYLFSLDPQLKSAAKNGRLLFGTLESYLIWHLTKGRCHQTDLSMAARTLMADIDKGAWSPELLAFFKVPVDLLPTIVPTNGRDTALACGGRLAASLSDQAAGLITANQSVHQSIAVNLGTGGFVMGALDRCNTCMPGYLTAPWRQDADGSVAYAVEGTINAIGPALENFPGPSPMLERKDPAPEHFCLPDNAGVGAPYWRADLSLQFSMQAKDCSAALVRRIIMEGIIFRVCRMAKDFQKIHPFSRLLISGGLSAEPFIAKGLAACSGIEVIAGLEPEATLWGAAFLAANQPVKAPAVERVTLSAGQGQYLKAKFEQWKAWVDEIMKA